jgi:YjbE family integral membrane protein
MHCFIKFIYYYKFILIEEAIILLQIIFIDIILAADNAIIIGLIAANFVPKYRKQIILWGVAGALVFKVIFAVFATYLFEFYFIKILGGLLLIWIVNDLRKDLVEMKNKVKTPSKKSKSPSYINSVYKVLFADITISFDNVIGVVGAAKGYFGFMIFGLILSVVLTGALAPYMANYIQKHIWIAYVGLVFILIVGLQLIIGGLVDLEILKINEEFIKYF